MKRTKYDHSRLEGMDADLETSLKEYGLAWIETDDEFLFYYGIDYGPLNDEYDDGMEGYIKFDFCSLSKDWDFKNEFNWVDWKGIESYIGMNFDDLTFTQKISDLLSYYGYENIFGSTYWEGLTYFEITGEK